MFSPGDLQVRVLWANWHQWHAGQQVQQSNLSGHSFWLVREGSVTVHSSLLPLQLAAGDALLWPAGLARSVQAQQEAQWLSVGLHVSAFGHLDLLDRLAPPRLWSVPPAERQELELWLRRLVQHRRPQGNAEQLLADGLARALVATIWQALAEAEMGEVLQQGMPAWMTRTFGVQRARPGIGVAELAAVAGVSSVHLRREFHRVLGVSPHSWLAERRLEAARHLLTSTDDTVRAVAHQSGYDSPSHFARIFKTRYGVSPEEYRRTRRLPSPPEDPAAL